MIYIFDVIEFQVLAGAKGLDEYYGFQQEKEYKPEDVYYAVYQMTKDGVFKRDEEGLVIQPPVSHYIRTICESEDVTVIDRGQFKLPRRCVYYRSGELPVDEEASRFVSIENSLADMEKVCLTGMDPEDFFQELSDLNFMPQQRLTREMGDYDFDGYWQEHISPELWELLMNGLEVETDDLLKESQIHAAYSRRDKRSGELKERLILIDAPVEYGLVCQQADGAVQIDQYEETRLKALLDDWWR
jgi:hypothetical protein